LTRTDAVVKKENGRSLKHSLQQQGGLANSSESGLRRTHSQDFASKVELVGRDIL
jgi:hypothetical protein